VSDVQQGAPLPIDGFVCIAKDTDCAGDNHDAAYVAIGPKPYYIPSNRTGTLPRLGYDSIAILCCNFCLVCALIAVLVVVGVDHTTAAGLAYSNVAINNKVWLNPCRHRTAYSLSIVCLFRLSTGT
jgi:hypothetical protein